MQKHAFGWKPSKPDIRDVLYTAPRVTALPAIVDLRSGMPAVYDQGQLGSCTANAAAAALAFDLKKQNLPIVVPSRLFVYYKERVIEGTVKTDSGAELRDAAKVLHQSGACDEKLCPYVISNFTRAPSKAATTDAAKRKITVYSSIDNTKLTDLLTCLASGYPFILGFTVYESFESDAVAKTGIVPMPKKNESVLGGHAVVGCGYDQSKKLFLIRNSWGAEWGQAGYCQMPFDYLTNSRLATDFWKIQAV